MSQKRPCLARGCMQYQYDLFWEATTRRNMMMSRHRNAFRITGMGGVIVPSRIIKECIAQYHDDVIKWKHFPRYWPFVRGIHRSPVNSPHKGQWRGALMFPLICVWINGWVNNREAGDLRRYRGHYDVSVMWFILPLYNGHGDILSTRWHHSMPWDNRWYSQWKPNYIQDNSWISVAILINIKDLNF